MTEKSLETLVAERDSLEVQIANRQIQPLTTALELLDSPAAQKLAVDVERAAAALPEGSAGRSQLSSYSGTYSAVRRAARRELDRLTTIAGTPPRA